MGRENEIMLSYNILSGLLAPKKWRGGIKRKVLGRGDLDGGGANSRAEERGKCC